MDKYQEGLIIEIEYPEDGSIAELGLSTHAVAIIEGEKSGITEGIGINYYILSDYVNNISEADKEIIADNCNITLWDSEIEGFDEKINEKAKDLGLSEADLLSIMGIE